MPTRQYTIERPLLSNRKHVLKSGRLQNTQRVKSTLDDRSRVPEIGVPTELQQPEIRPGLANLAKEMDTVSRRHELLLSRKNAVIVDDETEAVKMIAAQFKALGKPSFSEQLMISNPVKIVSEKYITNSEERRLFGLVRLKEIDSHGHVLQLNIVLDDYKALAKGGNVLAIDRLGAIYGSIHPLLQRDVDRAESYLSKSANMGYADSQIKLAMLHITKTSKHPSVVSAIYWLRAAAKNDNPRANWILGVMHEHGIVFKKDQSAASQYLDKIESLPS